MNGVERVGSTNSIDPVFRVTGTSQEQSTIQEEGQSSKGSAGMAGALELSGDFVRQAMTENGFVNIQARGAESIEAFVRLTTMTDDNSPAALEPAAAAELAVQVGTQMAGDANLAMRIQARAEPVRGTILLK